MARRAASTHPGAWQAHLYIAFLRMAQEQAMQSLQIERQAHQAPFAGRRFLAPQRELAEAQHLLDDPDHWLNGILARRVDRFANLGLQLVGHLHLRTGLLGWRCRLSGKPLLPTLVMRFPARGDVRLDATTAEQLN